MDDSSLKEKFMLSLKKREIIGRGMGINDLLHHLQRLDYNLDSSVFLHQWVLISCIPKRSCMGMIDNRMLLFFNY
jgi:hypothetical protein